MVDDPAWRFAPSTGEADTQPKAAMVFYPYPSLWVGMVIEWYAYRYRVGLFRISRGTLWGIMGYTFKWQFGLG
jgi:hypothetical protein